MRLALLSWLAMGLVGTVATVAVAGGFFPYPHQSYTLPNGHKSILVPMKGSGLVAYYTVVRTGSRDEWEPGKSGFAHFFEHMMFRGTKKYPSSEYNRIVNEMGAEANAFTSDDLTCFYMVVPAAKLETAMDLESDRFQNLSYEEAPFRTEAGAVYGEYRQNLASPYRLGYETLLNTAFDKHTYKHTTMGFERDIREMPTMYEYSKTFFVRYYRPENCVLLLVGDFDPGVVEPLIEKYYGGWKPGYVAPNVTAEPPQTAERQMEVTYDGRTLPMVWLAYKGDAFDPSDKMGVAAYLLADLAFGENSEVYKKLVIREQKVESLSGDFGFNRDPKLYTVFSRVKDENDLVYTIDEIDKTAERFKTELVNAEDLENVKKHNRYAYLMSLDTPERVGSRLARIIAVTGEIEAVDRLYDTMATITAEDIRSAARKYLQKECRTVLVLKGAKS
jgi:zinc protease